MDQDVSAVRERANEALGRFDWGQVGELLGSVDPSELGGEELFTLGTALNATGDWDQSEVVFQMAHSRAVDEGDQAAAAWTALFLTFMAGAKGEEALMGGWIATAGRFIEGLPECKVHALVPVLLSYPAMLEGDYDTIVESNIAARELARRLGERDLEMWALQREGMARAKRGEVHAGMAMVDEAMVAALSATMAPWAMGQIFCQTLTLCQELGDIKRASQWIEASDRVTSARGIAFSGDCRIHRAGVMKQRGSLARAEAEARLGCAEYTFQTPHNGWGWSEIGEIRLRVGDLEGAEEAFTLAHERGYPPDPGFALLRMAQGRPALAVEEIERALEQQVVDRSVRVKLLDAAVHIRLTVGDIAGAQAACEELTEIVAIFGSDTFKASALCSRGTLSAAHGDFETAKTSLRAGIADWLKVGAPYEAARARVQLAEVALRADDPHAARRELHAARSTFQELGAEHDAQHAARLLVEIDGEIPDPSAGERVEKTFMFTDIEQSTALAAAMGDEQWDRILRLHDRLLRDAIRDADGRVVKHEGDGVFAVFDTPPSGVSAAVCIQERLEAHRDGQGFAPAVRIGLHSGPATERNGDYFGMAVNTAARVMSLAGGGEIVATDTVAEGSEPRASASRTVELKGLSEPTNVVNIAWRTSPTSTS